MALNVAGLQAYVDQEKMALIRKFVLEGRSANFLTIQPDIKSSASINILSSELVAQAGGCGFTNEGETILTQQPLSVCPLKVNESICLDTLEGYYTQYMMNPGSYNTQIPFEQTYVLDKIANISSLIDTLIWQGNTATTGQTSLCDGYITLADTTYSGSVINGNTSSASAITANNIIGLIDDMSSSIDVNIINMDDLYLYVGYDTYRTYQIALRNANLFHYNGQQDQGENFSQVIPGQNIRVIALKGLNGTNKMFLSTKSNLYYGVDMLNDYENFELFFSQDFQEVRMVAKWKMGVNAAFWEYVSYFKLA
jgi:hypothetical protein